MTKRFTMKIIVLWLISTGVSANLLSTDTSCPKNNIELQNGYTMCKGADQSHFQGSKCTYACYLGYYLNGPSSTMCSQNSTWTHSKPTCEVRICPEHFLDIPNGHVTCYGTDGRKNWFDSSCFYECDLGFILVGNSFTTCTNESKWSADKPTCEWYDKCTNMYYYMNVQNGKAFCQVDRSDSHRVSCVYFCDRGYKIHGPNNIAYYDDVRCSIDKPRCYPIRCQKFNVPNGRVVCSHSNTYKSVCIIRCNHGFELHPDTAYMANVTCEEDGQWDDIIPICKMMECSKRYTILLNGQVQCDGKIKNEYGSTCFYSCIPGFKLIGEAAVQCTRKNDRIVEWSEPFPPSCEGPKCSKDELNVINGHVQCTGAQEVYGYNSTCIFKCNPGYELVGPSSLLCYINETWSSHKPICLTLKCSKPPGIVGGVFICNETSYSHGATCLLSCYTGYRLIGTSNITCMENKHWSAYGYCEDVEPPVFQFGCPDDLRVSSEKVGQMTYVLYTLPNATDNSGSENLIIMGEPEPNSVFEIGTTVVNVTARDKAGNTGFCQFNITVEQPSCGEPSFDTSEAGLLNYSCGYNYVYGDKCNLSCNDGKAIIGSNVIYCTKDYNTNDYKWVHDGDSIPSCYIKGCPKLLPPKNGAIACGVLDGDTQFCVRLCKDTYGTISRSSHTYMCNPRNGLWKPSDRNSGCIARRRSQLAILRPPYYQYSSVCHSENAEIKQNFIQALSDYHLCPFCNVTNVSVECYLKYLQ